MGEQDISNRHEKKRRLDADENTSSRQIHYPTHQRRKTFKLEQPQHCGTLDIHEPIVEKATVYQGNCAFLLNSGSEFDRRKSHSTSMTGAALSFPSHTHAEDDMRVVCLPIPTAPFAGWGMHTPTSPSSSSSWRISSYLDHICGPISQLYQELLRCRSTLFLTRKTRLAASIFRKCSDHLILRNSKFSRAKTIFSCVCSRDVDGAQEVVRDHEFSFIPRPDMQFWRDRKSESRRLHLEFVNSKQLLCSSGGH